MGTDMGLLTSIARGLRRVRSAIAERIAPKPEAPPRAAQLPLPLAPRAPAPEPPSAPAPEPVQLSLPLRPRIVLPAAPEHDDEQEERFQLETAEELAKQYAPPDEEVNAASAELDQLSAAAGDLSPEAVDLLMRGHPLLLSPLDLLMRWGGMDREEALQALAERELDGIKAAAELADVRGPALARWRAGLRAAAPAPEPEPPQPPGSGGAGIAEGGDAQAPLQGGDFERAGLTPDEAIRAAWNAWIRSTLAQVGGDQAIEIAVAGDLFRVPMHVWRKGPSAILDWVQLANRGAPVQGPTVARINGWRKPQSPKSSAGRAPQPRKLRTKAQLERHAERERARRAGRSDAQRARDKAARAKRYQEAKARKAEKK